MREDISRGSHYRGIRMHCHVNSHNLSTLTVLGLFLAAAALLAGCQDLNTVVNGVLGLNALARVSEDTAPPSRATFPRWGRAPETPGPERVAQAAPAKPKSPGAEGPEKPARLSQGKTRPPGELHPEAKAAGKKKIKKTPFPAIRDPFRQPTELLPSDCPPSTPLCRFDRSQLKLVGVIQVNEGQFKGMVEDPDGRGYFVTSGMLIGEATVTQVTQKGVVLRDHKTGADVTIPLYREPKTAEEF